MRPIKFRGRDSEGKFHFGDLIQTSFGEYIYRPPNMDVVYRNSIAQFVGCDKNGNELYEGDVVIGEYGDEVVARLMDNLPPKPTLKENQS